MPAIALEARITRGPQVPAHHVDHREVRVPGPYLATTVVALVLIGGVGGLRLHQDAAARQHARVAAQQRAQRAAEDQATIRENEASARADARQLAEDDRRDEAAARRQAAADRRATRRRRQAARRSRQEARRPPKPAAPDGQGGTTASPDGDDRPRDPGESKMATPVQVQRGLTVGELRRAEQGALAMQKQCLAMLDGRWSRAEALTGAAVEGQFNLIEALEKDPDTPYRLPSGGVSTMRQMTLTVADTVDSPSCLPSLAQDLRRAIAGLPR